MSTPYQYSDETPVPYSPSWTGSVGDVFMIRPPNLPAVAEPIYDDDQHQVVGYVHEAVTGVYKYYDIEGNFTNIHEDGLETPLFDPIDFFAGGITGIFRSIGKSMFRGSLRGGGRIIVGSRAALPAALRGTVVSMLKLPATIAIGLRAAFRQLTFSAAKLTFTRTAAAHMANAARRVPVHILSLAIKHGRKLPDPQQVPGASKYVIQMFRNNKAYTLEVVAKVQDSGKWLILHFHYK